MCIRDSTWVPRNQPSSDPGSAPSPDRLCCRVLRLGIATCRHASFLLALCHMRTLYLRNVPDDVVERLERLAARDATSVGAVAAVSYTHLRAHETVLDLVC